MHAAAVGRDDVCQGRTIAKLRENILSSQSGFVNNPLDDVPDGVSHGTLTRLVRLIGTRSRRLVLSADSTRGQTQNGDDENNDADFLRVHVRLPLCRRYCSVVVDHSRKRM